MKTAKKLEKINEFNGLLKDVQITRVALENARNKAMFVAKEFERLNEVYKKAKRDYEDKYDKLIELAKELGIEPKEKE